MEILPSLPIATAMFPLVRDLTPNTESVELGGVGRSACTVGSTILGPIRTRMLLVHFSKSTCLLPKPPADTSQNLYRGSICLQKVLWQNTVRREQAVSTFGVTSEMFSI